MTNKIITLYQNLSYPMRKRYVFCLLYMCTCAIKSKVPSYKNGIFYQMFALFHCDSCVAMVAGRGQESVCVKTNMGATGRAVCDMMRFIMFPVAIKSKRCTN
uniref:Uncharacterized protein n=1 Tax=Periophthalmus magnuspinnatus TaxID=409849 RepID=A0A3B3ZNQ8_9GOBI